jgi:hypothetical protein
MKESSHEAESYLDRATQMRALAVTEKSPEARRAMFSLAETYEQLAKEALSGATPSGK